jgi:outer membrane protein OmpA-like peptidoglycan-associated protein
MAKQTILTLAILLVSTILVPLNSAFAQDLEGRWVLGFHGGGNLWVTDYNTSVIGPGGLVMLRYGISPAFSAGLLAGYEELKTRQEPTLPGRSYLKLHAIPASAVVWVHFASGHTVNPYVYAGLGAMLYKRLDGGGVYIPDSKFITSVHAPVGVGLEIFPSKSVSIALDLGYRVTDDYTDAIKSGKLGGYATAKLGVNIYFGTSDTETQRLRDAEARRLRELAEAEALRLKQQAAADAEARRIKDLADAEARRLKDLADAEARRLAEQRHRDTVIVLEKGKTVVLKGVNFEFNKATLTRDSEIILGRALSALNASPDLRVLIVGHTDHVGSAAYNRDLSLRRANSVKSWLVNRGISAKRLTVAGKGEDEPIDTNETEAGRSNNRRVEFRVLE